ncbi:uncharacterized protein LOC116351623 [Contarinia nasturtii]|uniref:uncharacterized protein LOC116351623 n=1 Tax=Contarinia nasturtii TaxID=265458 RepID=UPI0012D3FFEB|nr:uncharacterized protein LOC116351623 [Contarinia nasturtii]
MTLLSKDSKIITCFLGALFFLSNQLSCVDGQIEWTVDYGISDDFFGLPMKHKDDNYLNLQIRNLNKTALIESRSIIHLVSSNTDVVKVSKQISALEIENNSYEGPIILNPIFFGKAKIYVEIDYIREERKEQSLEKLEVHVYRRSFEIISSRVTQFINFLIFFVLGCILDSENMVQVLKKPIGRSCILSTETLFAMSSLVLCFSLFRDYDAKQYLYDTYFDGIVGNWIMRHFIVWTLILKGNTELTTLTSIINIVLSIGIGHIYFLTGQRIFSDFSFIDDELKDIYELYKASVWIIIFPVCVGFGVSFLTKRCIPGLTINFKYVLEIVLTPVLILIATILYLAPHIDLFIYRMFTVELLCIGFLWPFIIYCGSLYVTQRLKFEPKDRLAITIEVIIANLWLGSQVSMYIIAKNTELDYNDFGVQLYPSMFAMTLVILSGHSILIYARNGIKGKPTEPSNDQSDI